MSSTYESQGPHIEAGGAAFVERLTKLADQPISTAAFAPQVAGQPLFTQQAQQLGATQAGLGTLQRDATGKITGFTGGTGIASFEPYLQAAAPYGDPSATTLQGLMSPYQQAVRDETIAEINRSYNQQEIAQAAKSGEQFGGSRYGVMSAELQRNRADEIAQQTAQLNQAAFQNAQQQAQQRFQNQLGLAQTVPGFETAQIGGLASLGGAEQGYQQSLLDAQAATQRLAALEPYERLGFFGEQLTGISAGVPTATRMAPAQPVSPATLGMGIAGLGTSMVGSIYGGKGQQPPSDIRLKTDIELTGKSPTGVNIYSFKYKGEDQTYQGVMAHEVPWASNKGNDGYYRVDYSKVDVAFKRLH